MNGSAEKFRDLDFDYGIIPSADAEITSAVLEAMASESYRIVTPAYYEEAMKVKYSRDDATSQMLDLIKNGLCYGFGIWNYLVLASNLPSSIIKTVLSIGDSSTWASRLATNLPVIEASLETYLATIKALEQ